MDLFSLLKRVSEKKLVLAGIVIIFFVAMVNTVTVNKQIVGAVDACNDHWREEIALACPGVLEGGDGVYYTANLSESWLNNEFETDNP